MSPEPGEQVYFHGHPSWRSMLALYLKGVVIAVIAGAIAGGITRVTGKNVSVGAVVATVLIIFVVVLVIGMVRRIATTYTISDQRLTIRRGLLSRDMQETRIDRVQNVNYSQSIIERMLQIGTVDFDTAGGGDYEFKFRGVADPNSIVRTVDRAIHARGPGAVDPTGV